MTAQEGERWGFFNKLVGADAVGQVQAVIVQVDVRHWNPPPLHQVTGLWGSGPSDVWAGGLCSEAGLRRPTVEDWHRVNCRVPRLVDVLPNGPVGHPTVRFFLAGGVPELITDGRSPVWSPR
jgi:hypothetical protein